MNKFLNEFIDRGFFYQCTNKEELSNILDKKKINAYIGFDSTAPSLHVGSLLQIMCLRLLQRHGHRPIVLLGGGTTRIGDPSGKEKTRKILSEDEIEKNIKNIKKVFNIFLKTDNPSLKPIYVNNFEWLGKLNYINFLRDVGKHFTINKMLSFDSVKLRLEREQSLSYMEFNYMILQAYDFLELNKKKNCLLQIGGSDQWGNIVNGVELIKRHNGKHVFGLTTPLITLASGAKMGKTEEGAVWLDPKLLSAYDYWQFWRNTEDADVGKFLNYFTDLKVDFIQNLIRNNADINKLKITLANAATVLLHGKKAAESSEATAKETFGKGGLGRDLPLIKINKSFILNNVEILSFLNETKIFSSKSEARRAIENKAIKINDELVRDYKDHLSIKDFVDEKRLKISFGKKKHFLVELK